MSNLIVVTFDNEFKADQTLLSLAQLQKDALVDLEDAVVVVKSERGRVRVKQTLDLTTGDAAVAGGWWGLLIGLILGGPIGGILGGAAAGALLGRLVDLGVDDGFIKDVGRSLQPGSSAIFVLVREGDPATLKAEFDRFDGVILDGHLSDEAQAWLAQTAQTGAPPDMPPPDGEA